MSEPLHRFDQDDFHVWITAIKENCDYILTTNHRRFPYKIGKIERIIHTYRMFNKWYLVNIRIRIWQGERLCAKGIVTYVNFDLKKQKSERIPDTIRKELEVHFYSG